VNGQNIPVIVLGALGGLAILAMMLPNITGIPAASTEGLADIALAVVAGIAGSYVGSRNNAPPPSS
jgi:hypothetical protein